MFLKWKLDSVLSMLVLWFFFDFQAITYTAKPFFNQSADIKAIFQEQLLSRLYIVLPLTTTSKSSS